MDGGLRGSNSALPVCHVVLVAVVLHVLHSVLIRTAQPPSHGQTTKDRHTGVLTTAIVLLDQNMNVVDEERIDTLFKLNDNR